METTRIDITKYVKSGEGANGESYNSIEDKNEMLKLYSVGIGPCRQQHDCCGLVRWQLR